MKTKKLYKKIASVSFILAITCSNNLFASTNKGSWIDLWSQNRDSSSNSHTSVPIDGGLGILVLGAAALGAKKLRQNKNA
ncbi:PID-CTERM protein-sorting domain-containing protein [Neotamlana laminarinivorans]|uniref:VPDSG-CTERM protein sorting domain-containing protein n=1 Tax=Neotamlana laminarinivorans TaxID=2883124 RepID=A0A9X1HYI6_9FLAO|nr:hypothetical protein [Tamlana laminarinivorans]MCB4798121.1 hypothetical protein [Tamlana laminarinivorans]